MNRSGQGEKEKSVRRESVASSEAPRVLFAYNHSYEQEVQAYERGEVPAHRLFGFSHLSLFGFRAVRCPQAAAFKGAYKPLVWRLYQALYAVTQQRKLACIVATHEASALPLLVLKKLGMLRTPVIMLNIALLQPINCVGRRRALWRWCLPAANMISSYASAQVPWLSQEFGLPQSKLTFTPLGVDTEFFSPNQAPAQDQAPAQVLEGDEDKNSDEPFILSVGTNEGKDFATLIEALPQGAKLKIYTDEPNARAIEPLTRDNSNITVEFRGTAIRELRQLYGRARMMVLPLREARYSSGQTVLLENMAMGRPVIISMTSGVRDYIEPGATVTAVEPGDVPTLRQAIERLWNDPQAVQAQARQAEEAAQAWSCEEFARKLAQLIGQAQSSKKPI
jgi:glycosyltransferase involved in cell wall biosynthesis